MTVYLKRMQVISNATQIGYFLFWVISKNLSTQSIRNVTIFSFPIRLISTLNLTPTLTLTTTLTPTRTLTLTKLRRKFHAANFPTVNFLAAKIPDTDQIKVFIRRNFKIKKFKIYKRVPTWSFRANIFDGFFHFINRSTF